MKYFLLIICCCVGARFGFAQDTVQKATINWGNKIEVTSSTYLKGYLGADESNHYFLTMGKGKLSVLKLNSEMNFVLMGLLSRRFEKKSCRFETALIFGGELYQFVSYFNSREKVSTLYVEKIDRESMRGEGTLTELFSVPLEGAGNSPNYYFVFSPSNNNLLIQFDRPNKVKRKQTIGTYVFTETLQEVWHKVTDIPHLQHEFAVGTPQLDAYGNVHIVSRKTLVGKDRLEAKRNEVAVRSFELMSIREQGEKVSIHNFDAGGRELSDLKVLAQDERYVRCVGFYSDQSPWGSQGYYYAQIDGENGELIAEKWSVFSARFVTDTRSSENQDRVLELQDENSRLPAGSRYRVSHLFENADKHLMVIAHNAKEGSEVRSVAGVKLQGMAGFGTASPAMWGGVALKLLTDDVLVFNIGDEGNAEWIERIDRNQTTFKYRTEGKIVKDWQTDIATANRSFFVAVVDQKIYFLHNNVTVRDSLAMSTTDSLATMPVDSTAKEEGNLTEMSLGELKADRSLEQHQMAMQEVSWFEVLPQFSAAATENDIMLYRITRKGWFFGRIQFANDQETTRAE
jgi:hypothetical protein